MKLNSLIINAVSVIIFSMPSIGMSEERSDKPVRSWDYTVELRGDYILDSHNSTVEESGSGFAGIDRPDYSNGGGGDSLWSGNRDKV